MSYLFWGTVILFSATLVFYFAFLVLVYYWHERKTTVLVAPLIYTFEFFLVSFLIMSIGVITLTYWQQIYDAFVYILANLIRR